jgi:glycosyltransferase involved in cell wall biosynthesis
MGFCQHLRQLGGFDIRVAYPQAGNVNSIQTSPRVRIHDVEGFSYHAIRPTLPAIEFNRYADNSAWDDLLSWADSCQVMGGGIAQGFPASKSQTPYAIWVASTREADGAEAYRHSSFLKKRWLDMQFHFIRRFERETLHKASEVFVISEYTRRLLESSYDLQIPDHNCIPVPVEADFFKPDPEVDKSQNTICYVGRVNDPRKQIPLLLSALRRVLDRGVEVHLKMAGEMPNEHIQQVVRTLKLEPFVEFVGQVPAAELPGFYQSSLINVLPSQEEGQGIVVLEAMGCEVPTVATRCGGPESLIDNGRDGFLIANGDENELAEKIALLIKNPEQALAMGRLGREHVLLKHTPEKAYARIIDFHLGAARRAGAIDLPASFASQTPSLSTGASPSASPDYPRT